jgi:hypothetical protein
MGYYGQQGGYYDPQGQYSGGYPPEQYPSGQYPQDGYPQYYPQYPGGPPGQEPQDTYPPGEAEGPGKQKKRRRSRKVLIAMLMAFALFLGGGTFAAYQMGWVSLPAALNPAGPKDPRELATQAASDFLAAWERADYAGMQALVADQSTNMQRAYGGMAQRLGITKISVVPGQLDAVGTSLPYSVTVTMKGGRTATWSSTVALSNEPDEGWKVDFNAQTVYPTLLVGQRLELIEVGGKRGQVTDRNGVPLKTDPDLKVNALGTVGKDNQGKTGLERVLNSQLAGDQVTQLAIVNPITEEVVQVIEKWEGDAGKDAPTTIDLRWQQAATEALKAVPGKAALVAIDTDTGEIRTMASQPTTGIPAALATGFAPGSTFKIVTAAAALLSGKDKDSTVPCDQRKVVGGRSFKNHEESPSETVTIQKAFEESCNTAFITLEEQLPDDALNKTAALFGFNEGKPLPITSVESTIGESPDSVESAANSIGQGTVLTSPLHMASVAAAIASGTWRQPRIVPDCPDCKSHEISVADQIRPMMRAVVETGTAPIAKNAKGGPVYGKTGTAEFGAGEGGTGTHTWFVGYQEKVAFAVFVEQGQYGGTTSAPIAVDFLNRINSLS